MKSMLAGLGSKILKICTIYIVVTLLLGAAAFFVFKQSPAYIESYRSYIAREHYASYADSIDRLSGPGPLHSESSDTVPGEVIRYIDYPINWDFDGHLNQSFDDDSYICSTSGERLGLRLPIDWNATYRNEFGQYFNPSDFQQNVLFLARIEKTQQEDCLLELVEQLLDRLEEYTFLEGGRRFVIYQFDYPAFDRVLEAPWRSGYAQGVTLTALSLIYDRFRIDRARKLADEILNSFLFTGEPAAIAFVDDGYYWIEEYPFAGIRTRVFNGHVYGMLGIFDYARVFGVSAETERLVKAAITTMREKIRYYRVPGEINCYDLALCYRDYLPERTVNLQEWLFEISSDPYFDRMAEVFREDIERANSIRPLKGKIQAAVQTLLGYLL